MVKNLLSLTNKSIFIRNLVIVSLIVVIIRLLAGLVVRNLTVLTQLFLFFYAFTPTLAVVLTEKKSLKQILKEYKVTLKNINFKKLLKYIIGAAILYPVFVVALCFFFGNVLGIDIFGKIGIPSGEYIFNGLHLSENVVLRAGFFVFVSLLGSLVLGLTYNMLLALGGEIAWRGFLGKNIQGSETKNNIITGVIWASWQIVLLLIIQNRGSVGEYASLIILTYIFNIVFSFFLSKSVKDTGSLFTSAAIRGIISSLSLGYFMLELPKEYLAGANGALAVVSVVLLYVIFNKRKVLASKN